MTVYLTPTIPIRFGYWTGAGFSAGHDSPAFDPLTSADLTVVGVDVFDNNLSKPHDVAYDNAQQLLAGQWDTKPAQRQLLLINYFQAIDSADLTFLGGVAQNPSAYTWGAIVEALSVPAFLLHIADDESIIARLNNDTSYAAFMTGLTKQQMETRLDSTLDMAGDALVFWLAKINDIAAAAVAAATSLNDLAQAINHGHDFADEIANLFAPGQGGSVASVLDPLLQILSDRSGAIHGIARASSSTAGTEGHGESSHPALSGDGRYVAFQSYAPDLITGDTNGFADIFLYDRQGQTTSRVSVGLNGAQANNQSLEPSISQDGRFIAFESSATNLVQGDAAGWQEIFVYDRIQGTTARVSMGRNAQGVNNQEPNNPSSSPSIAASDANGNYVVAYASTANNLTAGDSDGVRDIFVYKSATHAITRISNAISGQPDNTSDFPSVSSNGSVAFESSASNLIGVDTNGLKDVFLYNGSTIVRAAPTGVQPNGESSHASISLDGNFVAFESAASNLVQGDTNGASDIFVYSRATGAVERVSVGPNGAQANNDSHDPSISGDGRFVTFWSRAFNLVPGQTSAAEQTFVYDRQLQTTRLVSVSAIGEQTNSHAIDPVISADGTTVAFDSAATNLFKHDGGNMDVFVTDALNFFNSGGPQDDVIASSLGNDVLDGGGGNNTVSYAKILTAVTVNLATTGAQNTGGGGTDTLTNFSNVTGGQGADHLTGNGAANKLTGGPGNDTIDGAAGIDTAIFSGLRSAYTVTHIGSSLQVSGPDGVDLLTNVEKLAFNDVTMVVKPVHDFNGDNFSDILWRNNSTGDTGYSDVHNGAFHSLGGSSSTYSVVGVGDFNGDSFSDILWRNNSTGDTGYSDLHNNAFHSLGGSSSTYSVVGVGDFNGDSFSDILWRNNSTGDTGYSDLHNNAFHSLGGSSSTYSVVGVGDFNGDNFSDVLWRNNATGDTGYSDLHNGAFHSLGGSSSTYSVVGVGDFNGDSFSDILWRANSTGDTGYSDLHNNAFHSLGGSPTAYSVVGADDYNGDNFSDVLWRNNSTGDTGYSDIHNNVFHSLGGSPTAYLVVA